MPRKPRTETRRRILDAATAVLGNLGAAHMTLDAVAAEAGISKGGLLYHFASKDALLRGLIDQGKAQHLLDLEAARQRYPDTTGGYLQSYVDSKLDGQHTGLHEPQTVRSFIAAAANTPELLVGPRQHSLQHVAALRGAGDGFIDAMLLSLALDGLFFGDTFEMLDLAAHERQALVDALKRRATEIAQQIASRSPAAV